MERERIAIRPALIISRPVGPDGSLIWTLMITSARRSVWPGDVAIGPDHARYGLPVPCFVRTAKIAAMEVDVAEAVLGRLPEALLRTVKDAVASALA